MYLNYTIKLKLWHGKIDSSLFHSPNIKELTVAIILLIILGLLL
jgi:hypothetical protein